MTQDSASGSQEQGNVSAVLPTFLPGLVSHHDWQYCYGVRGQFSDRTRSLWLAFLGPVAQHLFFLFFKASTAFPHNQ